MQVELGGRSRMTEPGFQRLGETGVGRARSSALSLTDVELGARRGRHCLCLTHCVLRVEGSIALVTPGAFSSAAESAGSAVCSLVWRVAPRSGCPPPSGP